MNDKFKMTKEQNLSFAEENLLTNIYNSIKLEGINANVNQIKDVLNNIKISSLKSDEINCILNLRNAWEFILNNIDSNIDLDFICKINGYVSKGESLDWGILRNGVVGISGTNFIPEIPKVDVIENNIETYLQEDSITKGSIRLMLYFMRSQVFWDGNKRTSMLLANKNLIQHGKGIIIIKEDNLLEFNILLTEYYNTNDMTKIEKFIYDKCIIGIETSNN